MNTLRTETLAEESFAISRFLAEFAKVYSREIFVIYKSRKFILAKKIRALDSQKSRNLKKSKSANRNLVPSPNTKNYILSLSELAEEFFLARSRKSTFLPHFANVY